MPEICKNSARTLQRSLDIVMDMRLMDFSESKQMALPKFEQAEKHNDKVENAQSGISSAVQEAWTAKQGSFQTADTSKDSLPEITLCSGGSPVHKWIDKTYHPVVKPFAHAAVSTSEASERVERKVVDTVKDIQNKVQEGLNVFTYPMRAVSKALEPKQ